MGSVAEELAVIGMAIGLLLIATGLAPILQEVLLPHLTLNWPKLVIALEIPNIGVGSAIFMISVFAYAVSRESVIDL